MAPHVPHGKAGVVVHDRVHVEADGGECHAGLAQLQLEQDGGLAWCTKPDHDNQILFSLLHGGRPQSFANVEPILLLLWWWSTLVPMLLRAVRQQGRVWGLKKASCTTGAHVASRCCGVMRHVGHAVAAHTQWRATVHTACLHKRHNAHRSPERRVHERHVVHDFVCTRTKASLCWTCCCACR